MASVQDYVKLFNNFVVPAAVELYGIDYFTAYGAPANGRQAQNRLNEFGPFEIDEGDTRLVDMPNSGIQNAAGSLYAGSGGEAAEKFLKAVERFVGAAPLESIYETTSDPPVGLDQMLPLRSDSNLVPPPDPGTQLQTTLFTSLEFSILFSLMASYSKLTYQLQTEGKGLTPLGKKYTFKLPRYRQSEVTQSDIVGNLGSLEVATTAVTSTTTVIATRNQDNYYLALTKPVFQGGQVVLAPVMQSDIESGDFDADYFNLTDALTTYKKIKNTDPTNQLKPLKWGSPLKEEDSPFRQDNAMYIQVPFGSSIGAAAKALQGSSGAGGYFHLARLIAVNHQEALKDVAFDVFQLILKDVVRQEKAEQFTREPYNPGIGELDERGLKKEPARRKLTPNDFQCFLLERISELSAVHSPQYSDGRYQFTACFDH